MAAAGRHVSRSAYHRRRIVVALVVVALVLLVVLGTASVFGRSSTRTVATTSTTVARTTTTKAGNPVTMTFVGDTMLGNTPDLPPNPSSYLQPVATALAAPTVFGNLEGTLTDSADSSKCGAGSTQCYAFRTPTSYAAILKADGFSVLNSANNHSHDFGTAGLDSTTAALQAVGIVQAGLPGQIGLTTQGSTKIAFVDFAPYSTSNNLLDLAAAKTLIAQAKAEANVVVVYMHAGAEGTAAAHVTGQEETYVGEDRGNAEAFAHAAVDDGANLVVASGPHVLRGMQYYRSVLIAYSLGNFAGYQNFATSGTLALSAILRVTLSGAGAFQGGHFTSLLLTGDAQPTIDASGQSAAFVNQLSTADFGVSAAHINPDGSIAPPPVAP
jgi:poly-gamma-glutamate capsule biosynthesis protein CapA/YwtB (metallophosphatase superfamily)